MKNVFYNVARQDITNGLTDFEISSGQDYFILLKAPANANVKVRLNSNTAPQIPIYEFWQFKSADVEKIYLSADAINGEYIEYGQADGNVEITTNPQIGSIDSLASVDSFGPNLLSSLDKIINPYENEVCTIGNSNANSITTIFSKTLTCDTIYISLAVTGQNIGGTEASIIANIDGCPILHSNYNNQSDARSQCFTSANVELKGIKNKTLTITSYNSAGYKNGYHINEKTLKA